MRQAETQPLAAKGDGSPQQSLPVCREAENMAQVWMEADEQLNVNENDKYGRWAATYVLGSVAPPERIEYELHLAGCTRCTLEVAEMAGMPDLLALLTLEEVEMITEFGEVHIPGNPKVVLTAKSPGRCATLPGSGGILCDLWRWLLR